MVPDGADARDFQRARGEDEAVEQLVASAPGHPGAARILRELVEEGAVDGGTSVLQFGKRERRMVEAWRVPSALRASSL